MEDGRWKMEDGRWKMEDGRWKMEDGVGLLIECGRGKKKRGLECLRFLGKVL